MRDAGVREGGSVEHGGVEGVSARSRLVRAGADGELDADGARALEAHLGDHPEDRSVMEFERRLRGEIASAAHFEVPGSLRSRVEAMRGASAPLSMEGSGGRGRGMGQWARWGAIAASILVVVAASVVVSRLTGSERPAGSAMSPGYRALLVDFVGSQHRECELHSDMIGSRFKTAVMSEVPAVFDAVLGESPEVGLVGLEGVELLGAGPCAVPGRGRSVRMVVRFPAEEGEGPIVSVHIQEDSGELDLEPGRTYRLIDTTLPEGSPAAEIVVWRRDGFVYFVASSSGAALRSAWSALGASSPSGTI